MKFTPLILGLLIISCGAKTKQLQTGNSQSEKDSGNYKTLKTGAQKVVFNGVEILLLIPEDTVPVKGDLLLLPGWNFSNTKWCDSTNVCKTALKKGYRIIAPQMGQSIYATRFFPETRKDFAKYPTLLWLDSALNYLKDSFQILDKKRYVLGLSTGGRGVALLCKKRPGYFHAAAALSGDFDQTVLQKDPLCTLVYGPYSTFRERWKSTDNPTSSPGKLQTPVFLAHGKKDKVVPVSQTLAFETHLVKSEGIHATVQAFLPENAGHDFAFWQSCLPFVWSFFEAH